MSKLTIEELRNTLPQTGRVDWIGLRPQRRAGLRPVTQVTLSTEEGLIGDHYSGSSGKRQVTLLQAEHLAAVAAFLGKTEIDPGLIRRNIVISAINLLALKGRNVQLGPAVLEVTGQCHPCSRMEENLGPGGYNAMRGHGGLTARVLQGGTVAVGDTVQLKCDE